MLAGTGCCIHRDNIVMILSQCLGPDDGVLGISTKYQVKVTAALSSHTVHCQILEDEEDFFDNML